MSSPRFELTTFGETMLRLSVPVGERICDARSLEVEAGGAESNVCVALARLGRRTAWASRLPDNALGDAVLRVLRADGVNVSAVTRVREGRLGTYFIELATQPRASQVIYDRAGSAATTMTPADLAWDQLLDTRILHLTGITAALGAGPYAAMVEAFRRARAAGVRLSFDVNYRAKLWDAATAGEQLRPLLAEADVLFCKGADAAMLFGCEGEPRAQLEALGALTRARTIYCTLGEQGAALLHEGRFQRLPAFPVQIVDRIGSGDAFAAGALDGLLDGDPELGLQRGLALAAIALSQHGDRVLSSRPELEYVMARTAGDVSR